MLTRIRLWLACWLCPIPAPAIHAIDVQIATPGVLAVALDAANARQRTWLHRHDFRR